MEKYIPARDFSPHHPQTKHVLYAYAPALPTIFLVSDSKGHKPKHNNNNSCGVTVLRYSINEQLSDSPVLSIIAHKQLVRICLGGY